MTDTDRLAAALRKFLPMTVAYGEKYPPSLAERILADDPTLICPDPAEHREHECGIECSDTRSGTRWWGFDHECGGVRREMGKDMGWVRDGWKRRWVECIRCGSAIEFTPLEDKP